MGNLSKSYGHDTSKHKPTPRVRYFEGERRMDKAPLGVVERWIDPDGHVISVQLRKQGDVPDQGIIDRARAEKRRDGWVEHHQCPLTTGATRSPKIAVDLEQRPPELINACARDPQTITREAHGVEFHRGCPHIEWLITHRAAKKAALVAAKRGNRTESAAEVQAKILAEQREANRAMVDVVKTLTAKKGKTE